MRRFLCFLFILILLSFVENAKEGNKVNIQQSLKNGLNLKHFLQIRNLQATDETGDSDSEGGEITPPPPPPSVANTTAMLQFLDINGFRKTREEGRRKFFIFSVFFYFLGMPIPTRIFVPLSVRFSGLRHLEETQVKISSACVPIEGTESDVDVQGGISKKFDCNADATGDGDLSISYDKDSEEGVQAEIEGKNQTISADEINFSEDAAEASTNINDATLTVEKVILLQKGELINKNKYDGTFLIEGNLVEVEQGKNLILDLNDTSLNATGEKKEITCTVTSKDKDDNITLTCKTNNEPLTADLYWKSGMADNTKVILNMTEDPSTVTELNGTESNLKFKRSSSGLSGGVIAAIVIACVVALILASIVAIMLRRPAKAPIDSTVTIAGLKTDNNMYNM